MYPISLETKKFNIMKKKILLSFCSLVCVYTAVNAQATASANHNVTLSLTNSISIAFTAGGSGVTMSFANGTDYTNGVTANTAATLQVQSNKPYNVTVKAGAANFTTTAATAMPVNNILYVKEALQSSYVNLTTVDQNLLTSQARGTNSFSVSYKATPGFNYDAGTYTASVIYTATQQ